MKFLTIVSVNVNFIQILVPEISFELKLTNFEKKNTMRLYDGQN